MKWQFKLSMFFLILAWTLFLSLALYHTDSNFYYPNGNLEAAPSWGYSWIWYHKEQWLPSIVLNLSGLVLFIHGLITENERPDRELTEYKTM